MDYFPSYREMPKAKNSSSDVIESSATESDNSRVIEIGVSSRLYEKLFMPLNDPSKYAKLRLSNVGRYSIARPGMSLEIASIVKHDLGGGDLTITDALANVGGMTTRFAVTFKKVNACEIDPLHCKMLRNNCDMYGVSNVDIVCGDYLKAARRLEQDVIFFDPPWGGSDYRSKRYVHLGINGENITKIIDGLLDRARYIYLLAPTNWFIQDIDSMERCAKITVHRLISTHHGEENDREHSKCKMLVRFNGKRRTKMATTGNV